MQYLTIWDLFLTPIYLIVLTAIAKWQRDKRYPVGHPLREYYLKGLYLKFFGAIFIALIYQYYYGTGDTFSYLTHAQIINSSLKESPVLWLKLLFRTSISSDYRIYQYSVHMFFYDDPASYFVACIAAVFGLLNGTTYLPIALCFAYFSYTGIWAMYKTFFHIYPTMYKQLAFAFLFIPSTVIWGSAIFKDTICMFGLGWLTYTTFRMFINRDFSSKNSILLAISFYFIFKIKLYILLAFIPALSLWILVTYSRKRIKTVGLRWVINLFFIILIIFSFLSLSQKFSSELDRYSLENIAKTAETTRTWIGYVSEQQEGAAYDLGEFDPTIGGMLKKFPQAVVVTLFRPFLWESKKVIILFSALESLAFMLLTLRAFQKNGLLNTFTRVTKDSNLIFFFIFSIIFAFAVGISTYNFGTLSRYKIPCLPFYAAMITILIYNNKVVEDD